MTKKRPASQDPCRQRIRFITGSPHKFAEVNAIIGDLEHLKIDLPEIQGIDPKPIIEAKLLSAMCDLPDPLIVEDTSLFLECLPGLPGPLIKWFLKALGRDGLWRLADKYGLYGAEARTTIGYADGIGQISYFGQICYFEGSTFGRLVAPAGRSRFGWDPIFVPNGGDGRTYAQMSQEEKNALSHRGKAARELKRFLDSRRQIGP